MHDEGYHNWDKDTTEDFWGLVEKVDEINRRNRAADIQMEIYKAEKYRALAYRVELAGLNLNHSEDSERDFEPLNLCKLRKSAILEMINGMAETGLSIREISQKVDVPCSTIHRWLQQDRRNEYAGSGVDEDEFQCGDLVEQAGCQD